MELLNPLISDYTWANKPSVAPNGQIICVTDVGENGMLFRGNGTSWVALGTVRYTTTSAVSVTGTGATTVVATFNVKGGLVRSNGVMKVHLLHSLTYNANLKTLRVAINGNVAWTLPAGNLPVNSALVVIRNINSEAVQKIGSGNVNAGVGGSAAAAIGSLTVNTANDFVVTVTTALAVSTDTVTLENAILEIN